MFDLETNAIFLVEPCPINGAVVASLPWLDTASGLPEVPEQTLYAVAHAAAIHTSHVRRWDELGCAYDYRAPLLKQTDRNSAAARPPFEAKVLLGSDDTGVRYVLHIERPRVLMFKKPFGKGNRFTLFGIDPTPLEKDQIPESLLNLMSSLLLVSANNQ